MENIDKKFFPKILRKNFSENDKEFSIDGFVTFTDISGFTQLSEILMSEGFEGSEKIRDIIQYHFKTFTEIIESFNGDILNYSGDAILAYFNNMDDFKKSFDMMINFTKQNNVFSIRSGVSEGKINIHIFKNNEGYLPLFYGESILSAMEREEESNLMEYRFSKPSFHKEKYEEKFLTNVSSLKIDPEVKKLFVEKGRDFGSFSYVAALFLYTNSIDTVEEILKINRGRCHINKIEQYKNGIRIMCITGIPFPKSSPTITMGDFISDLLNCNVKDSIKGGITSGYIYSGFSDSKERMEYNLLGKTINRAARIANEAYYGQIFFDKFFLEDNRFLEADFFKNVNLKGIGKINLYTLKDYSKNRIPFYSPYFNRNFYLEQVEEHLKKDNILIIGGDEGVGKTHLISSYVYNKNLFAKYHQFNYIENGKNILLKNLTGIENDEKMDIDVASKFFSDHIKFSNYDIFIFDNCEFLDNDSYELIEKLKKMNLKKKLVFLFNNRNGDIVLDKIRLDDIFELLTVRTGLKPSRRIVEKIYTLTSGNIFLILNIFEKLVENEKITINFLGEWDFSSDDIVLSKDISSISQIIFSGLPNEEYSFLKFLSFIEKPIKLKLLNNYLIKFNPENIFGLVEKNFVEKVGDTITFKNEILKKHFYHSIPLKERIKIHSKIASMYETIGDNLEAGFHYFMSGEKDKGLNLMKNIMGISQYDLNYSHIKYLQILKEYIKDFEIINKIFYILLKDGRVDQLKNFISENKNLLDEIYFKYFNFEILFKEGKLNEAKNIFKDFDFNLIKNDPLKIKIMDLLSYIMVLDNDDEHRSLIEKTYTEFLKNKDIDTDVIFSLRLPSTLVQIGEYEKSEKIFRGISKLLAKKGEILQSYSVLVKMFFLFPLGKYDIREAIEVCERYLKEIDKMNLPFEKFRILHSLATNLRESGKVERSLDYENEALKMAELLNLTSERASIYIIMGRIFFNKGDINKSIDYYKKAEEIATISQSNLLLETINGNLGVCYHVLKNYKIAYNYYEKALDFSIKIPYSNTRFIWILNLALLSTENNDFETAQTYLSMAKEEIKRCNISERWIDVYQIEGNCYFLQGKYKEAINVLKPVIEESLRKNLLEIYYESLPYYAGSLIMTGNKKEGEILLNKVKNWLKDNDYSNVEDNLKEVIEKIN